MPARIGARRTLSLGSRRPLAIWKAASLLLPPFFGETRAGSGGYFDAAGAYQTAAVNAPRFDYSPDGSPTFRGLLLEAARTNSLRNSTMQGAAAGTPGTLPSNWNYVGNGGLTQSVVGTGVEYGMPYIDLRFNGTSSTTGFNFYQEAQTQVAAASGQTWAFSLYWRMIAGSMANFTSISTSIRENTAAGAFLSNSVTAWTPTATLARISHVRALNQATTAFAVPFLNFIFPTGVAIDITLRLYAPQFEQGAFASSWIETVNAAVTRAPDVPAAAAYSLNPALMQYRNLQTGARARKILRPFSAIASEIDINVEELALYAVATPDAFLTPKLNVGAPY